MGTASLLLPLFSAVVYVAGALFIKRATEVGAGTWRIAFVCNITAAAVFAPLAFLGGSIPGWRHLWQPAVVGALFVLGQVSTFRSLRIGDVSVATPVLGLKIVLVALFTIAILRVPLSPLLWAAAFLSSAAIVLLNFTRSGSHQRVGATIMTAGLAAAAYALFDVLIQRWAPVWGAGRFLPISMGFVALLSLPMPALDRAIGAPSRVSPWLLAGALCFAIQSIMFVSAVALYGQATMANILYSSRGLWSVLAVWWVGHWFKSREQHLGARIMAWRLCGAALLMGAIVLVVVSRTR